MEVLKRLGRELLDPTGPLLIGKVAQSDERGSRFVDASAASATGVGGRIKGRTYTKKIPQAIEPLRTTNREKAARFTAMLLHHIAQLERALARPVVAGDLSEQFLRALGGELWKAGEPVTVERLRKVAEQYFIANEKGRVGADFQPTPVQ